MPRSLPDRPRKMLPPPTTTTACTPNSRTSRICSAMPRTASGQIPTPLSPPRASPLSLRRMREYLGRGLFFIVVRRVVERRRGSNRPRGGGQTKRELGPRVQTASWRSVRERTAFRTGVLIPSHFGLFDENKQRTILPHPNPLPLGEGTALARLSIA